MPEFPLLKDDGNLVIDRYILIPVFDLAGSPKVVLLKAGLSAKSGGVRLRTVLYRRGELIDVDTDIVTENGTQRWIDTTTRYCEDENDGFVGLQELTARGQIYSVALALVTDISPKSTAVLILRRQSRIW